MDVTRRTFVAGAVVACAGCRGDDGGGATPDDRQPAERDGVDPGDDRPSGGSDGGSAVDPLGGPVDIGAIDAVVAALDAGDGFHYVPEARAWIVRYPPEAIADAREEYGGAGDASIDLGLVALYQKCTHLGCRVPECRSSGRFECPCHGSVFNRVGEWVSGPAPRGLDRFPVTVVGGRVRVDVGTKVDGRDHGVSTLPAEQTGPSCIVS